MKKVAMFNGLAVVVASAFNGDLDKHDKAPVWLGAVSGTIPNRNVLTGTVAENSGIEIGNTYLMQVTETQPDETYGRRFNYTVLSKLSALEIIQMKKELGAGVIFDVAAEVVVTEDENAKQS